MVLNVHFSFVFFYSKDKEPLKPKNMLKLAHQAIWDQTWWSASAAEIWLALLTSLCYKNEIQNELEMQIVLAFILNLNPLATPPHSPLSIRPHVPCPGGTLRGGSSQEQVDEGGLRGRAEHSIPHLSPKTSTLGTGSLRWSTTTAKDGGRWMLGREEEWWPGETFTTTDPCIHPIKIPQSHLL